MGTNYFWKHPPSAPMDPRIHIGKRSAAGLYCWDCDITLCVGGPSGVHFGYPWHEACPKCGKAPVKEDLSTSAAGRELGFAKALPATRPTGVRSCASFSWAQEPHRVIAILEVRAGEELVQDEYDRTMTGRAFLDMLETCCPLRFTRRLLAGGVRRRDARHRRRIA